MHVGNSLAKITKNDFVVSKDARGRLDFGGYHPRECPENYGFRYRTIKCEGRKPKHGSVTGECVHPGASSCTEEDAHGGGTSSTTKKRGRAGSSGGVRTRCQGSLGQRTVGEGPNQCRNYCGVRDRGGTACGGIGCDTDPAPKIEPMDTNECHKLCPDGTRKTGSSRSFGNKSMESPPCADTLCDVEVISSDST